jgi:hypothetical protein
MMGRPETSGIGWVVNWLSVYFFDVSPCWKGGLCPFVTCGDCGTFGWLGLGYRKQNAAYNRSRAWALWNGALVVLGSGFLVLVVSS